jgi:hypothetical protein
MSKTSDALKAYSLVLQVVAMVTGVALGLVLYRWIAG